MNQVCCGLQGMPLRIHSIQKVRQGEKQRIYNNKNENYQRFIAKETEKNQLQGSKAVIDSQLKQDKKQK